MGLALVSCPGVGWCEVGVACLLKLVVYVWVWPACSSCPGVGCMEPACSSCPCIGWYELGMTYLR